MRRRTIVAVLIAAAAVGSTGCGRGQQEQPGTFRVAVIPKGATHEHWKRVHIGANKAAAEGKPILVWLSADGHPLGAT